MKRTKTWLARSIAALAVAAAIGLGIATLFVVDRRPRTHDAHLFAYSAGMATEVSGRILTLHVTNNQRVNAGDPLVDIDPEPFAMRLRQARAQAVALKAQINLTGRQVTSQRYGADAAATQISHAREQLALAQETLHRLEPLLAKGYVTNQQIDEARTNERNAAIALTAATQQASQARQAVGDTDSLVAQLRGAEAAEALAARDLRVATLRAPFTGTVVGLQLAEGAYAIAGQSLFTLIKDDEWYAVADFRETELPRIAVGDPATVWTMSDDSRPIQGKVQSLGRRGQPGEPPRPRPPGVWPPPGLGVVGPRFSLWVRLADPPP